MQPQLPGIRACVFDAYGTLFDFGSAAATCEAVPPGQAAAITTLWRDKQVQYTWLRAVQDRHADFWQVTSDALDFTLAALHIATPGLHQALMALYLRLHAYPEVPAMLRELQARGIKTAILSNGTPAMLEAIVHQAGLSDLLDAVISVEEVGVFKPHPRVYQRALDRLGVPAAATAFLSSNGWDAWAASAFGMRVVWCNRSGQPPERLPGQPDHVIATLAALPGLLEIPKIT